MFNRNLILLTFTMACLFAADTVIAALNSWWKETNYTSKSDSADDIRYMTRRKAVLQEFRVNGKMVSVQTKLTKASRNLLDHPPNQTDAYELCLEMGAFVFANPNRHFGLENIEIIGAQGEVLSSRKGIRSACVR